MDLPHALKTINLNQEPPRAPRVLLYIPPHGRAVHCADLESASSAAQSMAAEKPGSTVAVYQLVGFAHQPVERPPFRDAATAADLLDSPPDSGMFGARADGDLSDEDQDELEDIIAQSPQESGRD